MPRFLPFFLLCSLFTSACIAAEEPLRVYLGTYTGQGEADAKGIYLTVLNPEDGALSPPRLVAECASPAFLAKHPYKPLLYAVGELGDRGVVYAFAIDEKSGDLTKLNEETVSGKGACHLCVCTLGEYAAVAVACYGSGTVHALPILNDGKLGKCASTIQHEGSGPVKGRQEGPHAHAVYFPIAGAIQPLHVVDLGTDKLYGYVMDTRSGELTEFPANVKTTLDLPPGAGPRHAAYRLPWSREFPWIFVLNELDSTICAFQTSENGATLVQTVSTLPEGVKPEDCKNSTAEIFIHPDGKFLYASNRGHDSIALFAVNPEDGKLTFVETVPSGGKHPRSFNISPDGNWLIAANRDTNNVVNFKIDRESGKLTATGLQITVPQPVCVLPVE